MSLPSIGAHCSLERCHVNDFLPIRCRCDHLFCKDHISPEAHLCSLLQINNISAAEIDPSKRLQRCAADKCNKPSLEAFIADNQDTMGRTPAVCVRCKQAFCATHREPASHACAAPDSSQSSIPRNEAGRALLAKMALNASAVSDSSSGENKTIPTKRKPQTSTNPKKVAQLRQVELMKMRHRAQPGDSKDQNKHVPIDQKLHVKVRMENKDEERIFWFRKTIGTGKALDMLASNFGVSSDKTPVHLVHPCVDGSTEDTVLKNDQLLASQVDDGSLLVLSKTS